MKKTKKKKKIDDKLVELTKKRKRKKKRRQQNFDSILLNINENLWRLGIEDEIYYRIYKKKKRHYNPEINSIS